MFDEENDYMICRMINAAIKLTVVEIADIIKGMPPEDVVMLFSCLYKRYLKDSNKYKAIADAANTMIEESTDKTDEGSLQKATRAFNAKAFINKMQAYLGAE